MRIARYQAHVLAAATSTAAALGCGTSSADMPVDPGTAITVRAFPHGVLSADATGNADLVAFQDGDGPWTAVAGADGVYRFAVQDERYAVAVGCRGGAGGTSFYYQVVSETTNLAVNGCDRYFGTADVMVDVQGLSDGLFTDVWLGDAYSIAAPDLPAEFIVGKGAADVFVRSYELGPAGESAVRVYIGPSLDVQFDQSLSIDMADALGIVSYPLTISDPASNSTSWSSGSRYFTPHAHRFWPVQFVFEKASTYGMVAPAARQPDDIARVEVTETRPGTERDRSSRRRAFQDLATPGAVTLDPPDFVAIAAPSVDTAAVSQLSVTLPVLPSLLGYPVSTASFTTDTIASSRYLNIVVRPGWVQGAPTVTLRVPDLRNLAGWSDDMALLADTAVDWSISAIDQNTAFDAPAMDGRRGVENVESGRIHPPAFVGNPR